MPKYNSVLVRIVVPAGLVPAELLNLQPQGRNHSSQTMGEGREVFKRQSRGVSVYHYCQALADRYQFMGVYPQNLGDGRYALKFVFRDPATVTVDAAELAGRQNLLTSLLKLSMWNIWASAQVYVNPISDGGEALCLNLAGITSLVDEHGMPVQVAEKVNGVATGRQVNLTGPNVIMDDSSELPSMAV